MDGKGEFTIVLGEPLGDEPTLAMPEPDAGTQAEQFAGAGDGMAATH